ncbi:hypothetical protein EI94DRAFT_1730675 [Lactarius quietus]|nr:hypothetical protein EI94DRAFT_1730675 [Lactarius quietus]
MDPPCQAYSSRECERQAIDAEIKSLEESIRALRRRRNAVSPISSLPPEVMAIIFSYSHLPSTSTISSLPTEVIADLFWSCRLPGMPPLGKSPADHLAWLRVAHVCHEWREIALNHPFFWSHVDFTNLTLAGAHEILARAKKAPLHLEARSSLGNWDEALFYAFEKEIQTRVSQICHLSVKDISFRLQKVVRGLTSPAPTLESLLLAQPLTRPFISSEQVSVPDTLFGGTTPRLFSLELSNCNISWQSPLLKGLRHLDAYTDSASGRPNLVEWLNALREMPNLEKLVLRSYSSSPMALPFPPTFDIKWSVFLPCLTHLDISATAKNCAFALSYLLLPALTRLCVSLETHLTNGGDVQGGLLSLLRHTDGPQDTEPLQSVLIYSGRIRANVLAWSMPNIDIDIHDPFTLLSVALSARVALTIGGNDHSLDRNSFLDRAMIALPLESIVVLTAQHRSRLKKQFWLRNAPKWHLLQCVRLAVREASGFIQMLLQDTGGGRESPLLPSLTSLVLIDVTLTARRTYRLCDALMKRVEEGVPLETLDLRTCCATTFTVQLLSEIVVDVCGPAMEAFEEGKFVSRGFVIRENFTEDGEFSEDYSDRFDENDSHTSHHGQESDGEEIAVEMNEEVA